MNDPEISNDRTVRERSASTVLIIAAITMTVVAAFLFTMGGSPAHRSTSQAPDAPSTVGKSVSPRLSNSDDGNAVARDPTPHQSPRDLTTEKPAADRKLIDDAAAKTKPADPVVASFETIVGHSVEGRPIPCRRIGDGEYVVLMMASIHGNEAAGTPLLNDLAEHVLANPELLNGVTLVLMPLVNPDGVASSQRYNARGVDLNRNFPAENRQNSARYGLNALSEPEALAIYQVLNDTLPDHIVTLHEPLQCVDYDGPAAALAKVMSDHCPLPVKKLGSRPGSLGSYAGVTLGIPTITFELPRNAADQSPKFLWRFYGEALIQAILHRHATNE